MESSQQQPAPAVAPTGEGEQPAAAQPERPTPQEAAPQDSAPQPAPDDAPADDQADYSQSGQLDRLRADFDAGRIDGNIAISGILALTAGDDVPYIAAERENDPNEQ